MDKHTFSARSCKTALISSATILIALAALGLDGARRGSPAAILLLLLGPVVIFFAAIAPTMKYTVTDAAVTCSCGPFRWKIPIGNIRSMVETDLHWLPWSEGWKIPGFALFKIRYGDVGQVRMCATALTRRILLIDTGSEVWGITPRDVGLFVSAVEQHRQQQ